MDEKEKLSIKNWEESDRPREKLMLIGKTALSKAELIAILMGSGNREESAVELAKRILNSVENNLNSLARLSISDLIKFKGIGEAKAISIIAALELGNRYAATDIIKKKKITGSKDIFNLFRPILSDSPYEEFWVVFLNRNNKIISKHSVGTGGISGVIVDPKRVFKLALENMASSIIICHNHPSGNLKYSKQDLAITDKIKSGGEFLEIQLLDHVIIGGPNYFSFADKGLI